jgi:galactose mutarotase-like enzyme
MADLAVVARDEGPLACLDLEDRGAGSVVTLVPGRGGIATRFAVRGREVLYLDRATLLDHAANVRGGNPVLFPTPGRLAGDAWSWRGRSGAMKQHGFARTLPWQVVGTATDGAARAVLRLESSEATKAQYPWDCAIEITYALAGAALRLDIRVENRDATEMPFGVGFHPYFLVPQADKAAARIPSGATLAFDNAAKREVPFRGFDLTQPEVDLHLVDHGAARADLELAGGARVVIAGSPEMRRWVIWTIGGKDYVCVEPWTCPGDALNTGDGLIVLPPGEARALWVEVKLEAKG